MRKIYEYIVILASVSLIWIQTAAAAHDQSHHLGHSHLQENSPLHDYLVSHYDTLHLDFAHLYGHSHDNDQSQHTEAEDCITCKMVKSGHDKAIVDSNDSLSIDYQSAQALEINLLPIALLSVRQAHSRAPPIS